MGKKFLRPERTPGNGWMRQDGENEEDPEDPDASISWTPHGIQIDVLNEWYTTTTTPVPTTTAAPTTTPGTYKFKVI